MRDAATIIPVKWNNNQSIKIDTGADHSIVDKGTIQAMRIPYEIKEEQVFGRASLLRYGTSRISIDIGDSQRVDDELEVLDTKRGQRYWAGKFWRCIKILLPLGKFTRETGRKLATLASCSLRRQGGYEGRSDANRYGKQIECDDKIRYKPTAVYRQ